MAETTDLDSVATTFDAVVVGAGPSGSACAYWLARAGWSVCVIERKKFPREKTCGDGLTPRAVKQIIDMGLEDEVSAHGHRFTGLRAFGFGSSVELEWPAHPTFPSYGYTITRYSLDELVARSAARHGAAVLTGVEATDLLRATGGSEGSLKAAEGVVVVDKSSGVTAEIAGRYLVVADGQNSRIGRELGAVRDRSWPMGMALRGYYRSSRHDEPWIDSHLDIRDHDGDVVPGYGWVFPLGDGRVNVGVGLLSMEGAGRGVNTSRLMDSFVSQVATEWGLSESTSCGPPTGGKLPMGLAIVPRRGPNTIVIGDAAGTINPFNGEGIAYAMESGQIAARVITQALARPDRAGTERVLQGYPQALRDAYGGYYTLGRKFVGAIGHPWVMKVATRHGMPRPALMRFTLKLLANLTEPRGGDAADRVINALSRLTPAA
jgi:menaquinone-9 beta-reductase